MILVSTHAADWLLTWLVHASVGCGFALLAARALVRHPRSRDLLWKAALVLPLATSLLAVTGPPISRGLVDLPTLARQFTHTSLRHARVSVQQSGTGEAATIEVRDETAQALRYAVLATMLFPAFVAITRMVRRHRVWRNELRRRRPIDARAVGIDARALLLRGKPVQFSVSPRVASAAAVGRREVCVSDALIALGPVERNAVVAHEIAHLERRDVEWAAFAEGVASMLAAQPLVRLVTRRLRRDAEFICDEAAVRRTGDPRAYVQTLVFFAASFDAAASAVGYGGSSIVERAERVLQLRAARGRLGASVVATLMATTIFVGLLALPRLRIRDGARNIRTNVAAQSSSATAGTRLTLRINVR